MARTLADEQMADRIAKLEAYENKTSFPLVVLAMVYLGIFAIQVLDQSLPDSADVALSILGYFIWLAFVVDLIVRIYLAPQRFEYIVRHPIDVIAIIVPSFRALRVLRVLTAGQWLIRRGARLAVGRTASAIIVAVTLIAFIEALSVLDAERSDPNANIKSFGDSIWWAAVTMSTVGYGDKFPVTFEGRMLAVGMMVVGVSLLGVVSATLATGFLAYTREDRLSEHAMLVKKLDEVQSELKYVRAALDGAGIVPAEIGVQDASRARASTS